MGNISNGGMSNGDGISLALDGTFGISYGDIVLGTSRIFITLDIALQTHYTMQNVWSPTGALEIAFDLARTTTVGNEYVLDSPLDGLNRLFLFIGSNNSINMPIAFTATLDGVPTDLSLIGSMPTDGKIHRYVISATTATLVAGTIASRFSDTQWLADTLSNLELRDIATPSNSESWNLDQFFPITTEQSSSGSNLLTYVNADASTREEFTLNYNRTEWLGAQGTTLEIA